MRKIVLFYDNGKSIGCEGIELVEVDDSTTDEQLDTMAFEGACEHIQSWFDVVEEDWTDEED